MLFPTLPLRRFLLTALTGLAGWLVCETPLHAGEAYKWSVQYLIDNSRTTTAGRSQKVSPRRNRGLALAPDGRSFYAGYIHSFNNEGEVRRISLESNDFDEATLAVLSGPTSKAIATDDKGRVYITDESSVLIYDADLRKRLGEIPVGACNGLATIREGNELVLYATNRETCAVSRFVIQEKDGEVAGVERQGFDGNGVFTVPGAADLRGIEVDAKGHLWMADLRGNKVFRMQSDGKGLNAVTINSPIDIAIDGARVFVTRWTERAITVLDDQMNVLGNLAVPWNELELSVFGNNRQASLAGIAVLPGKGFLVTNEAGQTANQRSTYGRADDSSDFFGGKLFRDSFQDDNEPILRATEVVAAP